MPALSDVNLGLLLSELVNRPTVGTINASKNPGLLKSLWTLLTVYQWTPAIQTSVDAAIRAAMIQPGLTSHVSAVALTRDALMSDQTTSPSASALATGPTLSGHISGDWSVKRHTGPLPTMAPWLPMPGRSCFPWLSARQSPRSCPRS